MDERRSPDAATSASPATAPVSRIGPVRRALSFLVIALAVGVLMLVGTESTIALAIRVWLIGFCWWLLSLTGMAVRIWSEPDLRAAHFTALPHGLRLTVRFLRRYRERFGTDFWLGLFFTSVLLILGSLIFQFVFPA